MTSPSRSMSSLLAAGDANTQTTKLLDSPSARSQASVGLKGLAPGKITHGDCVAAGALRMLHQVQASPATLHLEVGPGCR